MAKKQKRRKTRSVGTKLRGIQSRLGGVGAGQDPASLAPRTLPRGTAPRTKPIGNVQSKTGGAQLNPSVIAELNKASGQRKKKR